jgi:N-acetylgalactosamine-6-sulfatase
MPANFCLIAACFACLLATAPLAADGRPPNIVFLLADDLGYGDLGCYGHPYARTPNIDRLAREGTRFQQFYVTGVTCCPSRTGFMTSQWPASFPIYPAVGGFAERATVTELLKQAGYTTGHFGKWHIGPDTKPGTYGIDVTQESAESRGERRGERGRDAAIYDAAIRFIDSHRDRPFYVNVWGHSTHHPVNPPASYAERFRDVRVQESDFAAPMREKFATCRERGGNVDAAMRNYLGDVAALDDSIGRLLARLDELGLTDSTIVVFSSDHGSPAIPAAEQTNAKPKRERRETKSDMDEPQMDRSRLSLNLMGYNGAFRGGKHGMYEGGVRVPFIVRWPGHVLKGRLDERSIISGIDWLPTVCALAGIKIDGSRFEGEDVSAAWLGQSLIRTKPLLWKTSAPGSPAGIREGDWKLIQPARRRGEVQLYNLAQDPGETTNTAARHPQIVQAMAAKVDAWVQTLPKEYIKGPGADD